MLDKYYKEKYDLRNTLMLYDDIQPEYKMSEKKFHKGINILITGTLSESKGQLTAIRLMEKLENINMRLYIAGKMNAYGYSLKKYVEENQLKNIIFCGLVHDMNKLRQEMDISIVCSRKEAFGRTIIEDMLSDILVIACNTGSPLELIEDKKTGIIYQYDNINDLKSKILEITKDVKLLNNIKKNAKEYAQRFIVFNTSRNIEEILKEQ